MTDVNTAVVNYTFGVLISHGVRNVVKKMLEITTGLLLALFFIAGFFIGKNTNRLQRTLDKIPPIEEMGISWTKTRRVGAISAPSQQDIYLRDNPKIKEEAEEMSKTFGALGVDKVKP